MTSLPVNSRALQGGSTLPPVLGALQGFPRATVIERADPCHLHFRTPRPMAQVASYTPQGHTSSRAPHACHHLTIPRSPSPAKLLQLHCPCSRRCLQALPKLYFFLAPLAPALAVRVLALLPPPPPPPPPPPKVPTTAPPPLSASSPDSLAFLALRVYARSTHSFST
ncbi:hypothetical protein Vafri_8711 [Volvox africanus]|uniref:Uncharacterized protein n=1 Tax=Volvox africanus TaxID=51714 RepID=A0A8J4B313_9CHLO|nr:hypothetical protein Vafri_8711 [Volvox africanus]